MLRTIIVSLIFVLISLNTVQGQESNARVINMWETLNLRAAPSSDAEVLAELSGRTPLKVLARTPDNAWFQVQTAGGLSGWVGSGYVELLSIDLSQIPIVGTGTTVTVEQSAPSQAQAASSDASNGRVTAGLLNLRAAASTSAQVIARLPYNTRVIILARNSASSWLQIRTLDGLQGWVAAYYIAADIPLSSLPVDDGNTLSAPAGADNAPAPPSAGEAPYFVLGATSRQIFAQGQQLGNRRDVFSKVGDSITVEDVMYRPFGYGVYTLGAYGYLQPTIDFFMQTQARDNNSFNNTSIAAQNGWTTRTVLDPQFANQQICDAGETPLACEYRLTRPAVALIMYGSNDVAAVPSDQFAYNLRVIVEYSMANGVIPVLSTIPPRRGYEPEAAFYNELITQIASQYGISFWDFGAAMRSLPNAGLSPDGLHPSIPPEGFVNAANFTGDYLQYGYVMRNLTALQALDVLRRNVLQ